MEIDYVMIGKRIRGYRGDLKMTQSKVSELVKIEPSTLSHIERGATKVSLPTLIHIANALQVSLDALVYDSLEQNRHVSVTLLDELLSDCTDREVKAIIEIADATKKILREEA